MVHILQSTDAANGDRLQGERGLYQCIVQAVGRCAQASGRTAVGSCC